jgi:hypothetical protein
MSTSTSGIARPVGLTYVLVSSVLSESAAKSNMLAARQLRISRSSSSSSEETGKVNWMSAWAAVNPMTVH